MKLPFKVGRRLLLVITSVVLGLQVTLLAHIRGIVGMARQNETGNQSEDQSTTTKACAINLFGLPRAFESLVLPSLVKNVILPNAPYYCDYFVHYYNMQQEEAGRSGGGGLIHPQEVLLLERAVQQATWLVNRDAKVTVRFAVTEEADFWLKYQPLLDRIHHTMDDQTGKPLYFPWKAKTYKNPVTVDNIIKMWHSIQEAWTTMSQHETQYIRVAMLRSDVVYMTPIDVYEYPDKVVVPAFGRHPVSDRIVIGPAVAVEVWATQRFPALERHVQYIKTHDPGWGLHSERFMNYTIFPAMAKALGRERREAIVEHPTLCFFRARADESVWVSDCDDSRDSRQNTALHSVRQNIMKDSGSSDIKIAVEKVLSRRCPGQVTRISTTVKTLDCARHFNS